MSLQTRLDALITAIGADVKVLQASAPVLVLSAAASVPGGTPAGTVIVRTAT